MLSFLVLPVVLALIGCLQGRSGFGVTAMATERLITPPFQYPMQVQGAKEKIQAVLWVSEGGKGEEVWGYDWKVRWKDGNEKVVGRKKTGSEDIKSFRPNLLGITVNEWAGSTSHIHLSRTSYTFDNHCSNEDLSALRGQEISTA